MRSICLNSLHSARFFCRVGTYGLLYYAVFADDAAKDAAQTGMLVKTVTGNESLLITAYKMLITYFLTY